MAKVDAFSVPSLILTGIGSVERVGTEAKRLKGTKVLIITDKGVAQTGLLEKVKAPLEREGLKVDTFDEVQPEPPVETLEKCMEVIKKGGYDLLVGFGGGSSLDVAKIASLLATNPGKVYDYFEGGVFPNPGLKKILIPTTSGTGSEVTNIGMLTDPRDKVKKGIVGPYLYTDVAIVDPALTVTMPPRITAATGMDALTHAIESYVSVNATPITESLAVRTIELVAGNLRMAVANGDNLEVRTKMSMASLIAGMCFHNSGLGAVHALALPLGGKFGVAHGVANALLLSYVMEFNALGNPCKFAHIAALMGERVEDLPLRAAAEKAVESVRQLALDVGMPIHLKEVGVPKEAIPNMAKEAIKITRLLRNNPRKVTEEDLARIYEKAY